MSKRARAQALLENPLLPELVDEYAARCFARFKHEYDDENIRALHNQARAADLLLLFLQERCKALIDGTDDNQ